MDFDPEGRCVTGLRKETVAVCDWTVVISVDQIEETAGLVPAAVLRGIYAKAGIPFAPER